MSAIGAALPQAIYSTAQVRAFDRRAIDGLGIAGFELMQRAGSAALECLRAEWPAARSLLIYCGGGNNAGDGYVLAALARRAGLLPRAVAVSAPEGLTGDAALALALAREAGVEILPLGQATDAAADLGVDALLGTGLARDVDGSIAEAVRRLNAGAAPVLALDLPSGLDSDTGAIRGLAVEADVTITFVGLKAGLYLGAGPDCTGRIAFADLGLPAEVFAGAEPRLRRITPEGAARLLKARSRTTHKGLNGRVLVVGGAEGMSGAARLAAEAALRAGAGLVHAAVAPASVGAVMAGRPEIMCRGVKGPADLADWAEAADVLVVGPGLGQTDWGRRLAHHLLALDKPRVVDADALNFLAQHRARGQRWVLTPHPGEAGRLLDWPTRGVQSARDKAVAALVHEFGGFAVLKGAASLVAESADDGERPPAVCDRGNPGMATGGMGDLLSGVLGGLIGQFGLRADVVEAAVLAHAEAGDDAAAAGGERGLLASDLLPFLRRRVNPA